MKFVTPYQVVVLKEDRARGSKGLESSDSAQRELVFENSPTSFEIQLSRSPAQFSMSVITDVQATSPQINLKELIRGV